MGQEKAENGQGEISIERLTEIAQAAVQAALKHGASAADAVIVESREMSISRRLGKQEGLQRSEESGLGLRVFSGKRQNMVSSTDLSPQAIEELAERAVATARLTPEDAFGGLPEEAPVMQPFPDLDLFDGSEPSVDWLMEQCARAEDTALAVPGITNSEGADASYSGSAIALATSQNFAAGYRASSYSVSVSVLAGEGTGMERDYDYSYTRHLSDLKSPETLGKRAAERALARLNPRKVATCKVPVIFDPRVSRQLVSYLAGGISGAAIARGTSFLKDALGTQIFAPGIRVVDDPLRVRGLASHPFDGEGFLAKEMALVEDGVLQDWLLDSYYARKLRRTPNRRCQRSLSSAPQPGTTNFYLAAGTESRESLISSVANGLYVTHTFGMGVNLVTGDYSQGAAGFWIENGKLAYPVSEITIAGHLKEMFRTLTPASDLSFDYGTCAPTVRIEEMTIAGI